MTATTICADMACKHSRSSHAAFGRCSEKVALHNERRHGYEQPVIYKTCGCTWREPVTTTRAVRDEPQA